MNSKSNDTLIEGDVESTTLRVETGVQEAIPLFRSAGGSDQSDIDCPMFLKKLARPIVSTGKSLQLIQHVRGDYISLFDKNSELDFLKLNPSDGQFNKQNFEQEARPNTIKIQRCEESRNHARLMGVLTLPEVFLVSLAGLVGDGDLIYQKMTKPFSEIAEMYNPCINKENILKGAAENGQTSLNHEKIWVKFLADAITGRGKLEGVKGDQVHGSMEVESKLTPDYQSTKSEDSNMFASTIISSFLSHKPIMTVSRQFLENHKASWSNLNISQYIRLPPLNDENMRKAIYTEEFSNTDASINDQNGGSLPSFSGTDYTFGFQHDEVKQLQKEDDIRNLEYLYSFPTILPSFQV